MLCLCTFTILVQSYITFLLWDTYGLNRVFTPRYQSPDDYERLLLAPLTDFYFLRQERYFLSPCFEFKESLDFQLEANEDIHNQMHFICKCDIFQRSYDNQQLKFILFIFTIIMVTGEWTDISQQMRLNLQMRYHSLKHERIVYAIQFGIFIPLRCAVTCCLQIIMAESLLSPKFFESNIDLIVNFAALSIVLDLDKIVQTGSIAFGFKVRYPKLTEVVKIYIKEREPLWNRFIEFLFRYFWIIVVTLEAIYVWRRRNPFV